MGNNFSFQVCYQDKKTKGRTGILKTPHGEIKTPAFIPVGTCGTVKGMTPKDLKNLDVNLFFVNTYHLFLSPGADLIQRLGGLHKFISWDRSLISDSGGFQVYSLARNNKFGGKKVKIMGEVETDCKIDDEGVIFKSHRDGLIHRFTPEISIAIQKKLGADIILCFDECTYYPATYEYTKSAMEKTHSWALRCLKTAQGKPFDYVQGKLSKNNSKQALYGIVQGGVYQDLRVESAKFIGSLPFDGIAIGGVAVGESKKEMRDVLDWTIPILPPEKPRHLLGVGEIDDIFEIIARGIDTFDCVMPTRLGRMGQGLLRTKNSELRTQKWTIDITKLQYASDNKPLENACQCYTCRNFSRAYINHLFRMKELLAYRLLTIHNLFFVNNLVCKIRLAIEKNEFEKMRKKWLKWE